MPASKHQAEAAPIGDRPDERCGKTRDPSAGVLARVTRTCAADIAQSASPLAARVAGGTRRVTALRIAPSASTVRGYVESTLKK
jgi:hypothetical protein